ncbi:MAG TPA: outer membrane lipoprotein carrier protein LolA [Candidatus Polarisedimenticolia bacterium]|nr:outer membrane lipoprotein carrier protein LolA [Candidatus Polarisedimenticolia bacterium]
MSRTRHARTSHRFLPAALVGFLASLPLLLGASASADPYAGFDPALRRVLQTFDEAQARVHSISARFVERKEIGLLKNAVVQKGQFYHTKPDKFLWEYVSPEPKMLLMNGKKLVAYYPVQKQAEEIQTRLSRRLVKYFGLGQVFADLQEYYHLSLEDDPGLPGTDVVVMRPRSKRLEKRLLEVRVWIDEQVRQVRRLEYREADGDRTLFNFEDIQVNPDISPARYEIELPNDVQVSTNFSGFFAEKGR